MTKYNQYQSPKWQKRKSEIMALHDFRCQNCMSEGEDQLHVHHVTYENDRNLWEYGDNELLCLCSECHSKVHQTIEAARWMIAECARGHWGVQALSTAHDLMMRLQHSEGQQAGMRVCATILSEMDAVFNRGIFEGANR